MDRTPTATNRKALEAALACAQAAVAGLQAALLSLDASDSSTPEPANEWLKSADAAQMLGVHEKTLQRRARAREIPATKLGHDWRFRRSDLERVLGGL